LCVLFPFLTGKQKWFLKACIANLFNIEDNNPALLFGWRCSYNLVASNDFRVSPTKSSKEYAFSIVVEWQEDEQLEKAESDLLNLRNDWITPMEIIPQAGGLITYPNLKDQPAEAACFDGCFDRSQGVYRMKADNGKLILKLNPRGIRRQFSIFKVDGLTSNEIDCKLNEHKLLYGKEFMKQDIEDSKLILINVPIESEVQFQIKDSCKTLLIRNNK
jgi:hypothetical protein